MHNSRQPNKISSSLTVVREKQKFSLQKAIRVKYSNRGKLGNDRQPGQEFKAGFLLNMITTVKVKILTAKRS
jgi:hypothetical protein